MPRLLPFLIAASCGTVVANLYYAQPLIALIGPAVGLSADAASLTVTLTQIGYIAGLLLLVPLGDIIENRRLIAATLALPVLGLILMAAGHSAWPFLLAALVVGLGSVAAQMLIALTAHLAPDATRGQVVGNVMSGLLAGILLSRPLASTIADLVGWRAVFALAAAATGALAVLLALALPERRPEPGTTYRQLVRSLPVLLLNSALLRRRGFYQAAMFAAFTLFWTTAPLELLRLGYTQRGIALFALAGAAGALAAPLAGRIADRGHGRPATGAALFAAAFSFLLAKIGGRAEVAALVAAAILLDFAVQACLVIGQRAIYTLPAYLRGRLTGLFIALFFCGGAFGSAIASPAYEAGGWSLVTWIGFALPLVALALFATEFRAGADGHGAER